MTGMADILNKLNTLVRSSIHSVTSDPLNRGRRALSSIRLGKDIDDEIAALRSEVERALDEQDRREAEIAANRSQIAQWDQQADEAVARSDDASARRLIQQMQRLDRETAFLEADLDQHRRSAGELISRVNELEALVAESRRQESPDDTSNNNPPPHSHNQTDRPQATADDTQDDLPLAARLRQARKIARTQETGAVSEPPAPPAADDKDDNSAVEDSLAQRRARLSKPD